PGPTRLIINPTASALELVEGQSAVPHVESQGLGKLLAVGRPLTHDGGVAVIDAGVPLVVTLAGTEAPVVAEGSLVRLASDGPVRAVAVARAVGPAAARRRAEAVDGSI